MQKTEWQGLWKRTTGFYTGRELTEEDLTHLRNGSRICFRYNKAYEKDEKKPRFIYCIADEEAAAELEKTDDIENVPDTVSIEDALLACRKALISKGFGYSTDKALETCEQDLKAAAAKSVKKRSSQNK